MQRYQCQLAGFLLLLTTTFAEIEIHYFGARKPDSDPNDQSNIYSNEVELVDF